jgi:imidazolonepropionase-like amidohydrolase
MSPRTGLPAALLLAALLGAPASAQTTAIVGGRVVTNGPAGVIDPGVLVFDADGVIAVGADVVPPLDATVIDATGKWVTPGLFSAHSEIGLVELDLEPSTDDRAASTVSLFSVALDAADDFNPYAANVGVARADGVTRAALAPSSLAGLFGGQGVVVDTSGAPDSITRAPAFIAVSLDRGRIELAGGSRAAAFTTLEAALDDAESYPRLVTDGEGEVLVARDAAALRAATRGDIPLVIEADRASDLRRIAALAEARPRLRIVVAGAAEAHLAAAALAAAGVAVIVDPSYNLPSSFDALASSAAAPAALAAAGVDFAVSSNFDPYANAGYLAQGAGIAVAHGLSWNDAFDSVTGAPARMFGLGNELGSLEPGKLADVVVWDGDPLEVMSGAERVFIAGTEAPSRSRQTDLRDRYLEPHDGDDLPQAYRRPERP